MKKNEKMILVAFLMMLLMSCYRSSNCECTTLNFEAQEKMVLNHTVEGLIGLGGGPKARKHKCKSYEYSDNFSDTKCRITND